MNVKHKVFCFNTTSFDKYLCTNRSVLLCKNHSTMIAMRITKQCDVFSDTNIVCGSDGKGRLYLFWHFKNTNIIYWIDGFNFCWNAIYSIFRSVLIFLDRTNPVQNDNQIIIPIFNNMRRSCKQTSPIDKESGAKQLNCISLYTTNRVYNITYISK